MPAAQVVSGLCYWLRLFCGAGSRLQATLLIVHWFFSVCLLFPAPSSMVLRTLHQRLSRSMQLLLTHTQAACEHLPIATWRMFVTGCPAAV